MRGYRLRPVPRSDGCWYENRVDRRIKLDRFDDRADPRSWRSVFVSNHWAAQHEEQARSTLDHSAAARRFSVDIHPDTSKVDRLTTLPAEVLVEILKLVLPCQRTFHFSTTETASGSSTAVHQVCEAHASPRTGQLLRVASVCRQLRSIAYDVFYGTPGRNRFVLELSNLPLVSAVSSTHETLDFGSWTRISHFPFHHDSLLHPFSSATVRYVADLTICFSLLWLPGWPQTRKSHIRGLIEIQQKLEALSSCFALRDHLLKRLCIVLGRMQQRGSQFYSNALQFTKNDRIGIPTIVASNSSDIVDFQQRLTDLVRTFQYDSEWAWKAQKLDSPQGDGIAAPLLRIRGLKEVKVEGLFGEAFAEELRRRALRPLHDPSPSLP